MHLNESCPTFLIQMHMLRIICAYDAQHMHHMRKKCATYASEWEKWDMPHSDAYVAHHMRIWCATYASEWEKWDMPHSDAYVAHHFMWRATWPIRAFMCGTWLVLINMWGITHSMWCATCPIYIWAFICGDMTHPMMPNMSHLYARHDSFRDVQHGPFICGDMTDWVMHDTAHLLARHDSFRPAVEGEKQQPPRTTLHWQDKLKVSSSQKIKVVSSQKILDAKKLIKK